MSRITRSKLFRVFQLKTNNCINPKGKSSVDVTNRSFVKEMSTEVSPVTVGFGEALTKDFLLLYDEEKSSPVALDELPEQTWPSLSAC